MDKRSRTRTLSGAAVSLLLGVALAVPAGGVAKAATPPAALNGGVAAFEGSNTDLYLCDIPQGGCTNTGLGMKPGASPAVYSDDSGEVWAAFEANTQKLYVTERSAQGAVRNINTGLDIANLTTPAIAFFNSFPLNITGMVVAFRGINNDLDLYVFDILKGTGSWQDSGLAMYPGTSPSIADDPSGAFNPNDDGLGIAFANSANHLDIYFPSAPTGGGGVTALNAATTLGMAAGTSPSITLTSSGVFSVAFQDNVGALYLVYSSYVTAQSQMHLENIALPMEANTNPSLPQASLPTQANEVSVYSAALGQLCAWKDATKTKTCFSQFTDDVSPAVALIQGVYWTAFESDSGNFRAFNTATGSYFEQPMYNGTVAALSS